MNVATHSASMATADAVLAGLHDARFSCRAYQPRAVPHATLERMFTLAQRTPSWCNTQPWQVSLVSGSALERLSAALYAAAVAGESARPDFAFPPGYAGVYRDRRKVCGLQLYQVLEIGRDQPERAREQSLENFRFFGAPHVAFLTTDASLGVYGLLDCGFYAMSLLLAATAVGLDTIAQAALATYPDIVRSHLGLGADRLMVCGISLGYGDREHRINSYRTARATLDESVSFIS